jgi:hypothetical protein
MSPDHQHSQSFIVSANVPILGPSCVKVQAKDASINAIVKMFIAMEDGSQFAGISRTTKPIQHTQSHLFTRLQR